MKERAPNPYFVAMGSSVPCLWRLLNKLHNRRDLAENGACRNWWNYCINHLTTRSRHLKVTMAGSWVMGTRDLSILVVQLLVGLHLFQNKKEEKRTGQEEAEEPPPY